MKFVTLSFLILALLLKTILLCQAAPEEDTQDMDRDRFLREVQKGKDGFERELGKGKLTLGKSVIDIRETGTPVWHRT